MKRPALFLLFLFLIVPLHAQDDSWAYQSSALTLDVKLGSDVQLTPSTSFADVNSVKAELTFTPIQDDYQDVLDFQMVPDGTLRDGSIFYTWVDPSPDATLPYYWHAKVKSKYACIKESAFPSLSQ